MAAKSFAVALTVLVPRDFNWDIKWTGMLGERWNGILNWYQRELVTARLNADPVVSLQQAPWSLAEMREMTNNPEQGNYYTPKAQALIQREIDQTNFNVRATGIIVVDGAAFRGAWHGYRWRWPAGPTKQHYFAVGDIVFTSWLSAFADSGVSSQVSAFWPGFIENAHTPDAMSGIVAHELGHNVSDQGEHFCDRAEGTHPRSNPPSECLMNVPYGWPDIVMGPTVRGKILARREFVTSL